MKARSRFRSHMSVPSRSFAGAVALVLSLGLAACASNVSLDPAPVSDKSATPVEAVSPLPQGSAATPSGADQRNVSPVQVSSNEATQPDAMSRIVYFDFDSFVVKPEFASLLEANARYLVADKTRRVALEGHTDERGGREYNLALGQKRAESVRRALGLLGVDDRQVEAVSFGEEKPAEAALTEAAFAKNRRVEFNYR